METEKPSDPKTLILRKKSPDVKTLLSGLQLNPLPPPKQRDGSIAHAPKRNHRLSVENQKVTNIRFCHINDLEYKLLLS